MRAFIQALALLLAMEGAALALFPGLARQSMLEMAQRGDSVLRGIGAAFLTGAILLGFFLRFF